jgi:nucleoside-diphosphate-sugar epimerase
MKKILITGSLGYLGSVSTEYLADRGYGVVGYDTGFFKKGILYPPKTVATVMSDARDIVEKDLEGIYAVVHLAGISNDPFGNLDVAKIYDPTRVYAKNIAEMCKKKGIKFVFASSCSVYGKGGDEALNEESLTEPQTPYSINKLQIEQDLRSLADASFSPVALRFATVFGPSPRLRLDIVINMFVGMAVGTGEIVLNSDGTAWRPNVHILDVAEAVYRAIETDWKDGLLVLNVGDEQNNMRIVDIAHLIASHIPGCQVKFAGGDPKAEVMVKNPTMAGDKDTRTYQVSFEKIKKIFPGYRAGISIELGCIDFIKKMQEVGFSAEDFKDPKFYRLKTISRLYDEQYLSEDLRWLKEY